MLMLDDVSETRPGICRLRLVGITWFLDSAMARALTLFTEGQLENQVEALPSA